MFSICNHSYNYTIGIFVFLAGSMEQQKRVLYRSTLPLSVSAVCVCVLSLVSCLLLCVAGAAAGSCDRHTHRESAALLF